MILADAITPPSEYATWLACVAFSVMLANQGFKLFNNFKGRQPQQISPQPLTVQAAAEYVHKHEFEKHAAWDVSEHNGIHSKIGGAERGLREALKSDVDELHAKANSIAVQVAGLSKATEMQNQQLASIVGTQNTILGRLPRQREA
jgi:hypothetical protein